MALRTQWATFLDRQHRDPIGLVGQIIGERMVRQHTPETNWTIDLLDLCPTDRVLEVGFGAGRGLALAAERADRGLVTGIDRSPTMVQAAARRNRAALRAGRLTLLRGDLRALPFGNRHFDKIWSIHTFYFWPDPQRIVGAVFGVLLALVLRHGSMLGWRAGSIGGFVMFLLAAAMKYDLGFAGDPSLPLVWLAVLLMGWGTLLGNGINATARQTRPSAPTAHDTARRAVLKLAGGSVGVALAAWGVGHLLQSARSATGASRPLELAKTPIMGPSAPSSTALPALRLEPAPGTRPELTPTEHFYRIDIDTRPPTITGAGWALQVAGLFSRPRPLTLADLMAYPAVLQPITISCISNPVGGDLIGTSTWVGARLPDVLADLGLRPEAQQLAIVAADGFYESVTMADMLDLRTLLVYGMNGNTLPIEHGFPLRIYIPNHYGMKQPKWITRIEAIDHEGPGYWVERGWSKEARPQIIAIIDTVTRDTGEAGPVTVGGIAWAGDRGIAQVEVQVDDGAWSTAKLRRPPLSSLTWVQWRYDGLAPPGRHTFRVRATDGTGTLQIGAAAAPAPNGATGYHALTATV